jgi:type II secretory pathway component GspD/PulD (secretin)
MPLRFTIRDLLWLTLVVALAVGWWADHRREQIAIKLHFIANLQASAVAKELSDAFAGTPVRFSVDERMNAIVIESPLRQQKGIEELIERLDQAATGN